MCKKCAEEAMAMTSLSCLIFSAPDRAPSIICPHSKPSLKPLCIPNTANISLCRSPLRSEKIRKTRITNTAFFLFGRRRWRVRFGDEDDFDGGVGEGEGEMEYEEDEDEDDDDPLAHNWNDYEADYNDDIISPHDFHSVQSRSFVNTQGWKSETVVHHRINQDEFHKIRLLHCDFFIRKAPDPDDDVFDFREMYVTPPEMDVYSIPEVVGKMPDKYVRLRKTDYGCYNVMELPVDRVRDKFAKTEFEVMKVFLMKHYKNKRADDPEFVLDFEEIYVIDSEAKSISRAKVVVNVPRGKNCDRRDETLIVRDQGTSFKIIPLEKRDSHDVVIEKLHWEKSRKEIETYLRSFRDFDTSNWF